MLDRKHRGVDLVAHLQQVTSVDEDSGAVGQHDRGAGRAGEAGQPGQPLLGGRDVFVLLAVRARHDEAGKPPALEFRTQRRDAPRTRRALASVVERLKARLEHGAQSINRGAGGQRRVRGGWHDDLASNEAP